MHSPFLIHRKFLPMNQNAPRGCAARGDEVYAEHTARARKCTLFFFRGENTLTGLWYSKRIRMEST